MAGPSAIFLALDLVRTPILANVMREHPLPSDVLLLIRIAAGSNEALRNAAELTGKSRSQVRRAAVFYIQQILWDRGSDSYRALGVPPDASREELAENLRWLMKWLHPDKTKSDLNRVYAQRVLDAWEQVKTPERRKSYNQSLRVASLTPQPRQRRRRGPTSLPFLPWVGGPKSGALTSARSYAGWFVASLAIAVSLAVVVFWARPM